MKKRTLTALLFLAIATILSAQTITVKVATMVPPRSPWEVEQNTIAKEWAEITGGKVKLQFYSMDALGGEIAVLQKMRNVRPGQRSPLDGAIFSNIGMYELAPQSHALTIVVPYTFRNQEELTYTLDKFYPEMSEPIREKGFELLGWMNVGWATFFAKEEVRSLDKIKTLNMSSGGFGSPAIGNSFKAAGFSTVDVPPDKLAQQIRTPNLMAAYSIPLIGYATQIYKHMPYVIDKPICPILSAFVVSENTWKRIPAEYHDQLIASVKRAEDRMKSMQEETDRNYLDLIEKNGGTLIELTAEEDAAFEEGFNADVEVMSKVTNSVIDLDFYNKILVALEEYRKNNE